MSLRKQLHQNQVQTVYHPIAKTFLLRAIILILDMDLSSNGQDLCSSKRVMNYQFEECKRTIIRMKEAAVAFTQIATAAQGALAVLHGRRSKFYWEERPKILKLTLTWAEKVLMLKFRSSSLSNGIVKVQARWLDTTSQKRKSSQGFLYPAAYIAERFLTARPYFYNFLLFLQNLVLAIHSCKLGRGNYVNVLRCIKIEYSKCKTHPTDIQGLQHLKNGINPNSISSGSCLSSWNFTVDPCDNIFSDRFTCGFRCDLIVSGFYRVTEISLDQAGYSGSLCITNLPHLEVLDMSYNLLSGLIPHSLSNLTRLRRLSLSKNSFTGKIPSSIGSLLRLQELFLDNNNLTGSIPRSFNGFVNLNRLELQHNNITGDLPIFYQLRNLFFLDLSDNRITGNFFTTRFSKSIIELSLRNNYLNGEFPLNVGELKFLQVLDLSHNLLSGIIPSVLFYHSSLQQLTLSYNNFTLLQVPEDLRYRSNKLIAIDLSCNNLHGFLPAFMASMPKLSALNLEHNKFSGMIPTQYAVKVVVPRNNTSSFERLLLGGNYLFGPIPGPLLGLKPGSVNVSLVDNCLYMCPNTLYICHGGNQKSFLDCKKFRPMIP
nr:LRR receptor-like serine/threonine-protein kinase GSO1 [Nicotiana tomentosiformis]